MVGCSLRRPPWLELVPLVMTGLVGACLPDPIPRTLLTDAPKVIGMSVEVIEDGPWSTELLPIPADRTRAEALPGDRVRLTTLVADENGALDLEPLEPIWLRSSSLIYDPALGQSGSLPMCESDPQAQACIIGTGPSVEWTIPDLVPSLPLSRQQLSVRLVIGLERSSAECLDRLVADVGTLGWECLAGIRPIHLGPLPELARRMLEEGIPLDPANTFTEVPELPIEVAPDFAPRIPSITLVHRDHVIRAWPGERTRIPADTTFQVQMSIEPRDEQQFLWLGITGEVSETRESVGLAVHTTADVYDKTFSYREVHATADVDSFTLFLVVTDIRESQTWSIFDFEVEPR